MESFFSWLLQNLAWETLKKALPPTKQVDVVIFKRALVQAQDRLAELEQDRKLLEKLVDQRNRMHAELVSAKRQLAALEETNHELRSKIKRLQAKK